MVGDNNQGLRIVASGVAVENLIPEQLYLKVHILGLISTDDVVYNEGEDADTSTIPGGLKRTAVINCKYYGKGSNVITPPTVRRGTSIEVYQFEDADQFFWRPSFYESDLMGKELELKLWSNIDRDDKSNHGVELTKENSYYLLVDTINKKSRFHTSKNDNEPAAWDILLDTKKGELSVAIDNGTNFIFNLDSFTINTETINLNATVININGKSQVNLKTGTFKATASLIKFLGGTFEVISKLIQKGSSNFKSSVTMNKNATDNKGHKIL